MRFSTKVIHSGQKHGSKTGSVTTPIYQTSTFAFKSHSEAVNKFLGKKKGFIYTRLGNPTTEAFEKCMADLEEGQKAVAFSSGMAAVTASVLAFVKKGDHIISTDTVYGCTYNLFTEILSKLGLEFSMVNTADLNEVKKSVKKNTKIVFLETPANPTLKLTDINKISKITKKNNILLVVDNTFATPYCQQPLKLGADVVLHSATKYIGGHSDLIAGVVITSNKLVKNVHKILVDMGGVIDPFVAWLCLRGLKTLAVRMEVHNNNAQKIAEFLESHRKVERVFYPGLKSHPQHKLAKKQMNGYSGIIAFKLKGGIKSCKKLLNSVKIPALAVSLGGVETLIQHPYSMTHAVVPVKDKLKVGITKNLVRISVGIEDVYDLIEDLKNSIKKG